MGEGEKSEKIEVKGTTKGDERKKESLLMLTDGRKGAREGEQKARLGEVNGVS